MLDSMEIRSLVDSFGPRAVCSSLDMAFATGRWRLSEMGNLVKAGRWASVGEHAEAMARLAIVLGMPETVKAAVTVKIKAVQQTTSGEIGMAISALSKSLTNEHKHALSLVRAFSVN